MAQKYMIKTQKGYFKKTNTTIDVESGKVITQIETTNYIKEATLYDYASDAEQLADHLNGKYYEQISWAKVIPYDTNWYIIKTEKGYYSLTTDNRGIKKFYTDDPALAVRYFTYNDAQESSAFLDELIVKDGNKWEYRKGIEILPLPK